MALYFNEPKDGSKYATLSAFDQDTTTKITFDEARIVPTDEGYLVGFYATELTQVIKVGAKDWKFEPCLVQVLIHKTAYKAKKKNGDKWESITVEPTDTEKYICSVFETNHELYLNNTKAFKGSIYLGSAFSKAALTGKDNNGVDIPETGLYYLRGQIMFCKSTDINWLTDLPVAIKAKSGWSGSSSQSESERLKERFEFLKAQTGCPDATNVIEIAAKMSADIVSVQFTYGQVILEFLKIAVM